MSEISTEWKELRPKIGNFICHVDGMNAQIDASLKKLQEKEEQQVDLQAQIDEAYNKGLNDMFNAFYCLLSWEAQMTTNDIYQAFGFAPCESRTYADIVDLYSPKEFIDKINQWKANKEQKEQELHVGDEIMVIDYDGESNNRTFVIYEIDDYHYYVIEPITFYKDGFYKDAYDKNQLKKTGKHYDSIPLSKEIK